MQRVSLRRAGERVKGGYSLSRKRITPFKSPKRKVLTLQASSSKSCDACRLHFPARGIAAFSVAIRFASAPIIRCRSAHLVEVQPNFRLPPVSTMRRAQQAAFGKQSAAEQTSLAPHDSKARLRVVTKRRDSWRSHVHCTYIAQRVQLFKIETANVRGRGAEPLAFSWGSKGAILSRERMAPFTRFFARRKGLTPPRSGSYQQSYLTNS